MGFPIPRNIGISRLPTLISQIFACQKKEKQRETFARESSDANWHIFPPGILPRGENSPRSSPPLSQLIPSAKIWPPFLLLYSPYFPMHPRYMTHLPNFSLSCSKIPFLGPPNCEKLVAQNWYEINGSFLAILAVSELFYFFDITKRSFPARYRRSQK